MFPCKILNLQFKELERCKSIGMKGIQIGSHINDLNLDEAAFFPIYAACEELDMCNFCSSLVVDGQRENG